VKHNVYIVADRNTAIGGLDHWKWELSAEGQLRNLIDTVIDPEGEEIIQLLPQHSGWLVITKAGL
jgi:hypothetical protein